MKDYYKILGVDRDADQTQIKKAYREKMKLYHPDARGGKGDQDKLIEVQEAYEVLSNKEKKKKYDEYLKSLDQKINRFSEISLRVLLSPAEAKYGTKFNVEIPIAEACPYCELQPNLFCPLCNGVGFVLNYYPVSITIPSGVRHRSTVRFTLRITEDKEIQIAIKIFISSGFFF
ncbi:MAG: hypothetical protein DRG27_01345 [Deltaproteobacteria bacterium]|nr:MAG: hypothetical protein DRG27_01345 [Deltaproteobacteria bacterium]